MSDIQEKQELLKLLEEKEKNLRYNRLTYFFPDKGPYRRELYKKHIAFMNAGKEYMQRAFIAANRTGKTLTAGIEVTYHLTGRYPEWWQGRRFEIPIEAWAAGDTSQTTRDVIQELLLGHLDDVGSGLIPKDCIVDITRKPGVADSIETVVVRHSSGENSYLTFKSYDQKRKSFQGTYKHLIWLDEEPSDAGIYSECLTRLVHATNPGILLCTFTPLYGLSKVVLDFLPHGQFPRDNVNGFKYIQNVTWDDVPHLTAKQKEIVLASYSKHERDARTKGIPSLGAGAIYPYLDEEVTCSPFAIREWWPKGYGLDVGWDTTAAIFGAMDPDSRTLYIYSEHYAGESHPAIHASGIKNRGFWLYGAIDPASAGSNQVDGRALFDIYEQEGLQLIKADNSVEAGILRVGQMMEAKQLKIFTSCTNLLSERRTYRRDEKGRIVKKNDHALDALRYLCMTGIDYLTLPPSYDEDVNEVADNRDEFTGY